jgi:hypothetical protein
MARATSIVPAAPSDAGGGDEPEHASRKRMRNRPRRTIIQRRTIAVGVLVRYMPRRSQAATLTSGAVRPGKNGSTHPS